MQNNERINHILAGVFSLTPIQAQQSVTMPELAGWDSLSHMRLIVEIEKEFHIQLSGDDIADMTTFDAIREIVAKYTE